jgi:hypothetical protein
MVKRLLRLAVVVLFSIAVTGSAFATMIKGKVTNVENEERPAKDGKKATLRVGGSGTALEGVGDRGEIKEGMRADAGFDSGDGNTAKALKVNK